MHAGGHAYIDFYARVRAGTFLLPGSCWMTKASSVIIIYIALCSLFRW